MLRRHRTGVPMLGCNGLVLRLRGAAPDDTGTRSLHAFDSRRPKPFRQPMEASWIGLIFLAVLALWRFYISSARFACYGSMNAAWYFFSETLRACAGRASRSSS